jgi:predicted acyl esterase
MRIELERTVAEPVSEDHTEHFVPMRDGVRLATDGYLPPGLGGQGPGATVLARLGRGSSMRSAIRPSDESCRASATARRTSIARTRFRARWSLHTKGGFVKRNR